jgi:hypothetical protein
MTRGIGSHLSNTFKGVGNSTVAAENVFRPHTRQPANFRCTVKFAALALKFTGVRESEAFDLFSFGCNERPYVERKWTERKPAVTTWVPRKEVRFERRRNTRHSNTDICRS